MLWRPERSWRALTPVGVLLVCFSSAPARAQQRWVQTFTGSDTASTLDATADGGAFVAGQAQTFDAGVFDVWVTRVDANGLPQWELTLPAPDWEQAAEVLATPDGGCIVVGFTRSFGAGGLDGWILKFSAAGALEWQRTYGGPNDDEFTAIDVSPNGYYVGGTTDPDPKSQDFDSWVLEIDLLGNVLWQKSYGGDFDDLLRSLVTTPEGLVFTANARSEFSGKEVPGGPAVPFFRPWLVALDGDGDVLWQKTYNYSGGDGWSEIIRIADGYVAVGEIIAMGFFRGDVWVVKLDFAGNVVWDRRYGDNLGTNFVDSAVAVRETADGGFAVLADTGTAGAGSDDWWLLHLDQNGLREADTTYGLVSFDLPRALDLAPSGDILAAGFIDDRATVMRLASDGETSCDLTSPTGPIEWNDALIVEDWFELPVPTAIVPASSTVVPVTQSSDVFLCLPTHPAFCDASDGSLASCPCANPGDPDSGCDIPQATGGVRLDVVAQSTSPNGATLQATGFAPMGAPTAIVIRSNALDPGSPTVFGDGLRCVASSPLVRLAATSASAGLSTHTFGHGAVAGGGDFHYQVWFRSTPITFCDAAAAFNLSNGQTLSW